ncbi:MAG: hypothetical protein WCL27_12570 [Betaproteobacteria bacterium]
MTTKNSARKAGTTVMNDGHHVVVADFPCFGGYLENLLTEILERTLPIPMVEATGLLRARWPG